MANIFGNIEPPRWLQEIARPPEHEKAAQMLGTALAGGFRALTQDDTSFAQGYQQSRMSQADPMWDLKQKHIEAQNAALWTASTAKWMDYDRKLDAMNRTRESMSRLSGWDPATQPIPEGITDPVVLQKAINEQATAKGAILKAQDQQNKLAALQAKIDNDSALLGIKQEKAALDAQKLQVQQSQFEQKLTAQKELETIKQQGRIDIEKLRALERKDAQGRDLTRAQYINRHLNTVYKDLVQNNLNPAKPVTIQEAQKVLSDAYDSLPKDEPTNKLPKVISITPAP